MTYNVFGGTLNPAQLMLVEVKFEGQGYRHTSESQNKQVSSVTNEPGQHAVSHPLHCTQRKTISVINFDSHQSN